MALQIKKRFKEFIKGFIKRHKISFSKAMLTAVIASAVDFSTLITLVEVYHVYYVWGVAIGAFCGAVTNFTLNRHWTFDHEKKALHAEGTRYGMVASGSLILNTSLVYCFTEFLHLHYLISKCIVAVLVGWGWNYPLQRFFVFPPKKETQ